MTVWYHQSTILKCKIALRMAGLLAICVAFITTLFLNSATYAAPGINQTLSFQGRLLTATGGVVTDGYYNIQFKIYKGGTDSGGGTKQWEETYKNNSPDQGVQVKNGYFSVNLGSKESLSSVDWNDDTLYLSMNIAGSATGCTTFGSGPCVADGEMTPMKRITSVPYAMQAQNANTLGNKTAANFIQLAQGVQTDATGNSSIFINKTGSGDLIQLQNNNDNIFRVTNTGDIALGNASNHSLSVATSDSGVDGRNLTISAGNAGSGMTSMNGGDLVLQGGESGVMGGNGGNVTINAGISWAGTSGVVNIGESTTSAVNIGASYANSQSVNVGVAISGTSNITIGSSQTATAGTTTVQAKNNVNVTAGGNVTVNAGSGNAVNLGTSNTSTVNVGSGSTTTIIQGTLQAYNLDTPSDGSELYIGSTNATTVTLGNANGNYVINNGATAVGNLLENPGFEAGIGAMKAEYGWLGGTIVQNATNANSGNKYMQRTSPADGFTAKYYAVQPGQVLYYGGYVSYASGGSGTGGFFIEATDKDKDNPSYSSGDNWANPGTSYTLRTNTYTVPAGKYFVRLATTVRPGATGNWKFDDLILRLASESGPKLLKNEVNSTTAFQIQNASATSLFTADTTNMQIVIGSSGNTITLSSSGITLAGNARGTKQIRLAAEYQNTVLDNGTGSNNNGTMTSSYDISNRMNYYRWTATNPSTAQTYDIVTQIPIPQDFSAWAASNPLTINTRTNNTSNGTIALELQDSTGTAVCTHVGTPLTMGNTNWTTQTPSCISGGTYTAGDYLTIRLRMSARNNANVDVGNIVLNYLSNK